MNTAGNRFRKHQYQPPRDKTVFASTLREIGGLIHRGDHAAALAKANTALNDAALTKEERSRVLAMVADSEFKRGRFGEAAQIQLQVAADTIEDPTLWLRAYIGEVMALLKSPNVEEAVMLARHAVDVAETKMADFDEQVRLARQAMEEGGTVETPPVPVRVSVVATRMGYLFLQEGEPEAAEEFFNRAIDRSKGGANRARQGLAKIALAKGEFRKAISVASDAIRLGGYKAKTLEAWKTVISARRQLGGWMISQRLIDGLEAAPASLRARATLILVRELRKNDMRQWRGVAENWTQKEGRHFPHIEAEIRKMELASAKLTVGNAAEKREKAEALLQTPGLGPTEWLSGAKELVRASLWEGRIVNIGQLASAAGVAYGQDIVPRVRHSLALSCMMAKRHDMARPTLQGNIQQLAHDNPVWGKSVWALARMESLLGDHATAAPLYRQFADETSIEAKFRLQAQLLWCQELIAAGQPGPLLEARSLMEAALANVSDPDVLMNFARQLQFGPEELQDWGRQLFEQVKADAIQRFNAAESPDLAINILFKLARRQVMDLGDVSSVVAIWESFSDEKRDWLWSERSTFWEYLGQVFEAYHRTGDLQGAEAFARIYLDDPATPVDGRPSLGIPMARELMQAGRSADGLKLYEQMASVAPTHPLCAEAWYWMALVAYKRGETSKVGECARRIRDAQGTQVSMLDQWNFDARAFLLLANLNPAAVDPQAVNYTADFLQGQLQAISDDLGRIP